MTRKEQLGFTLLEMMAALLVLLVVAGIVMSGMSQMMNSQSQIANRTEMHSGVRSATELLQQEIGQAGKVSLGSPTANVSLASAITAVGSSSLSFNTSTGGSTPSSCGNCTVYPNEVLTVDVGTFQGHGSRIGFVTNSDIHLHPSCRSASVGSGCVCHWNRAAAKCSGVIYERFHGNCVETVWRYKQ